MVALLSGNPPNFILPRPEKQLLWLHSRCREYLHTIKVVSHTDYKTKVNIYTHVRDEMLWKATVNMGVREQGTVIIGWNYDYSGRSARSFCVLDCKNG